MFPPFLLPKDCLTFLIPASVLARLLRATLYTVRIDPWIAPPPVKADATCGIKKQTTIKSTVIKSSNIAKEDAAARLSAP